MWANLTPILTKLPRTPANGSPNRVHAEPVAKAGDWSACLADLDRYRAYSDDWDGQGAKGIPGDLIDSAIELTGVLRSHSVAPPVCVLPGFSGTVGFEWDLVGGGSITLEITRPETAEFELHIPDGPYEFLKIGEPVTA